MSAFGPLRAVIFDMDGLLVNSEPFWKQAETEVFTQLGVNTEIRKQLPDTTGLRIDQVVKLWFSAADITGVTESEVSEQIIEQVIAKIIEQRPLLPGVMEALALCQKRGLKIGLASASPIRMIHSVVSLFGLQDYFMTLSSAGELPYSKPHPQVYLNAASALGVDPLQCLAIEDSVNGMVAAKAARMRVIAVPAKQQANLPVWGLADYQFDSLEQLSDEHLIS